MAEYRIEELADASGVSARNIRAYRERGLLDPPRREGRSAFYGDQHLSQLKTIGELLARGFTSAHIAEFFTSTRQGHDLADILGLQQAIFGGRTDLPADPLDLDPDDASRLVGFGLAEWVDGRVAIGDPELAAAIAGADDQRAYVAIVLEIADRTASILADVAAAVVEVWERGVVARFGPNYVPRPEDMVELQRMVTDYRLLGRRVVTGQLTAAFQRRLVDAVAEYTADVAVSGQWDG